MAVLCIIFIPGKNVAQQQKTEKGTMKSLLYLLAFTSFFSCKRDPASSERSTQGEETTSIEQPHKNTLERLRDIKSVDDIKKEHSYITSTIENGSMDSTSFNYNCNEEKKGELIYFYEQGQLRLIRHNYNEYSHFSATDEYYLKDDTPFLVLFDHLAWSFIDQNQTQDNITEKRFYFIDHTLIKCLQKEFTIISGDKNAPQSNMVPNKNSECPSLQSILQDFQLLFNLRKKKEDIHCLEDEQR